ncbi:aspartyl-phosphate phosphatase Spo0E family protein [Aneurinibacillus aneurinilyticus]|uniref:Aspartyl-phosphate phosphatase Spo0E family protein n=1 Tax=Aneurinibacillus aneurinilyticus TaxID=1391 RepID=A0A848CY76_ANEAE|nr:aspartyl-phosphate phosphatase Spo0E family protein [Aneurinibacillus aneurinilyticus]MED0668928.1 aspartyl-phosphate phosphatase Spo0E family protein [Aneurinibacillus aneurinilyticus]NMF00674.1 aspartyl-phosphate phosphatase Spo0E family protein [Aneurinibacillus aneurinilyticus]
MSLAVEIEQKRSIMVEVAKQKNFNLSHPDVLRASQELDRLIEKQMKQIRKGNEQTESR